MSPTGKAILCKIQRGCVCTQSMVQCWQRCLTKHIHASHSNDAWVRLPAQARPGRTHQPAILMEALMDILQSGQSPATNSALLLIITHKHVFYNTLE